jgi:hypothetical protein
VLAKELVPDTGTQLLATLPSTERFPIFQTDQTTQTTVQTSKLKKSQKTKKLKDTKQSSTTLNEIPTR